MSIDNLKELTRQRWMIPVLAQFAERQGQRHAVILRQLPISRESLSRTLEAAVKAGWVARNAGHGHPLRPEYQVIEAGLAMIDLSARVLAAHGDIGLEAGSLGRWMLPMLGVLKSGEGRFNALQRALGEATPRAVAQAMKSLLDLGLIEREVIDAFPPVPHYRLSARGKALAEATMSGRKPS